MEFFKEQQNLTTLILLKLKMYFHKHDDFNNISITLRESLLGSASDSNEGF